MQLQRVRKFCPASRRIRCRAVRSLLPVIMVATLVVALSLDGAAQAQPGQPARVRVTVQPDCFRPSLAAQCDKRRTGSRLDLGPQVAIWIEGADGRFVDTLMVTNLTALLGIGNRPGHKTLASSPKFPYGRRPMSLPVWAHRRGKLYTSVVMQDGLEREFWLGFHESVSSPDPYFCRPMTLQEIDVDAISCPTQRFNSVKGRFMDPAIDLKAPHLDASGAPKNYVPAPMSFYPPRNDLRSDVQNESDCDFARAPNCPTSSRSYADINDLDLVAAATPAYGQPYSKTWRVPDGVPDGNYVVFVEVSKEFDTNSSHAYPATEDPMLRDWGLTNNFGQPSVVWKVPFTLDRGRTVEAATTEPAGYGDWDGATGKLHAPDSTLSQTPGSGVGRLLPISQASAVGGPATTGRVLVVAIAAGGNTPVGDAGAVPETGADTPDAGPGDGAGLDAAAPSDVGPGGPVCAVPAGAAPIEIRAVNALAEEAEVTFVEPTGEAWEQTEGYVIKVWGGNDRTPGAFASGTPRPMVVKQKAGGTLTVTIKDLKSESDYTVGVMPAGECLDAHLGFQSFTTVVRRFTMLSGCFIATAAYGTPQAAAVSSLRRVRERARQHSALAEIVTEVYARSSPPLADVLRGSEAGRAVVRTLLAPMVSLVK
jgi:hypothetical protein